MKLMSMSALESYVLILMNTMAISTQVVITVIMKCSGAGPAAAKPFGGSHLTVARRRPVRLLRGEADELAIARALI